MDPVGPNGETLMDYSLFDARRAGFSRVVFLIREEMREVFERQIGSKYANYIEVEYAYQSVNDLPVGPSLATERKKPWGTGHAVWAARERLQGDSFAVINADDFYGSATFAALIARMREFLTISHRDEMIRGAFVGYRLRETLSAHGAVSRGICKLADGNLQSVEEWSEIRSLDGSIVGKNSSGDEIELFGDEIVSMNVWAFPSSVFSALEDGMREFVNSAPCSQTDEFYLPTAVDQWIASGRAAFLATIANCKWMGVTYKEDKPKVSESIGKMIAEGTYPNSLFRDA